jgi:hypothetical protein
VTVGGESSSGVAAGWACADYDDIIFIWHGLIKNSKIKSQTSKPQCKIQNLQLIAEL